MQLGSAKPRLKPIRQTPLTILASCRRRHRDLELRRRSRRVKHGEPWGISDPHSRQVSILLNHEIIVFQGSGEYAAGRHCRQGIHHPRIVSIKLNVLTDETQGKKDTRGKRNQCDDAIPPFSRQPCGIGSRTDQSHLMQRDRSSMHREPHTRRPSTAGDSQLRDRPDRGRCVLPDAIQLLQPGR